MACPHTLDEQLRKPLPSESVYREDCTRCFDSIDDDTGLDVCLYCFNGGCTNNRHAEFHHKSTSHPLTLNIRRVRKPKQRDEPPQKITKLEILAETEEDRYDTLATVRCWECGVSPDRREDKLWEVTEAVLQAATFARQEEVKAWELELEACEHTLLVEQHPAKTTDSASLAQCTQCDLKENLWLCLTCGNLACGRAQKGGVSGNGHGLAHHDSSHHPVAVKLGSITPEGKADVYCYACNEERIDPELIAHLANWGIDISTRQQTEKSLTELNIEENLKLHTFSMTTEDGEALQPVFGPGLTGLKNLGNSCYLSSIIQCLFSLPAFQRAYYHPNEPPIPAAKPAEDLDIQLRKIADGLLSGLYSYPNKEEMQSEDGEPVTYQKGLAPSMLKYLIGRGHEEFSTMRQQDSFELLLHLFKLIQRSKSSGGEDPTRSFKFVMEQRLQCASCNKVRYRLDEQDNIMITVPVRRRPRAQDAEVEDVKDKPKDDFEAVTFKECLDIFTGVEKVELQCPSCHGKDGFFKQSFFKTFPYYLAISAHRFETVNWVPTKLDIPVIVDDQPFDLDSYMSKGQQLHEELLPEDAAPSTGFVPNETTLSQLQAMGFPTARCQKALHATGNSDSEAAMNWLFAHMDDPDIDEPVELTSPVTAAAGGGSSSVVDENAIDQMAAMGIAAPKARKALKETGGDIERAIDWVFSHPDDQGDFDTDEGSAPAGASKSTTETPGSTFLPATYRLSSIVCHKGASVHAGHYVAFIRKPVPSEGGKEQWVLFNDEKVVKAESDVDEMKKFAYVYFFERAGVH